MCGFTLSSKSQISNHVFLSPLSSPKQSKLEAAHIEHNKGSWNKSRRAGVTHNKEWKIKWAGRQILRHNALDWLTLPCFCMLPLHRRQAAPWPVSQDSSVFARLPEGQLHWCGGQSSMLAAFCLIYTGVITFVFVISSLELDNNSAILKDMQWTSESD